MTAPSRPRLDPTIFNLPVGRLRAGYYSDAYFNFAKELLEAEPIPFPPGTDASVRPPLRA